MSKLKEAIQEAIAPKPIEVHFDPNRCILTVEGKKRTLTITALGSPDLKRLIEVLGKKPTSVKLVLPLEED